MAFKFRPLTFKIIIFLVVFATTSILVFRKTGNNDIVTTTPTTISTISPLYCYYDKSNDTLESILADQPPKNKSIFFHETSCKSAQNNKIVINARQACAVESAAKLNPSLNVYLLYTSHGIVKNEKSESDRFINALLSYKNVKLRRIDYEEYLKNTPVEDLWTSGTIERSNYVHSHASDVLRFVTLWRYGGIYLDLDVIVMKSFENLSLNFAGAESNFYVAAGVLGFYQNGIGHDILNQCLNYLKLHFNGQNWASNGPLVITQISKKHCQRENVYEFIGEICNGNYIVYPPEMFYPIPWNTWRQYFQQKDNEEVMKKIQDSYVAHMWNKLSEGEKINVNNSQVPYVLLAKKYCPKVFSQCEQFF